MRFILKERIDDTFYGQFLSLLIENEEFFWLSFHIDLNYDKINIRYMKNFPNKLFYVWNDIYLLFFALFSQILWLTQFIFVNPKHLKRSQHRDICKVIRL